MNKMGGTMHNSIIFYILLNGPLYIYIESVWEVTRCFWDFFFKKKFLFLYFKRLNTLKSHLSLF